MRPILRAENIGKQYRIGQRDAAYATLRESLTRAAQAPFHRIRKVFQSGVEGLGGAGGRSSRNGRASNRFWALKDVSFEVKPGEVIGIIGRNGAGKSTLLKVLSRVTEPTTGQVELFGRVGSLLEVGTGFHPELTGRENIYLNGAILGMGRHEIERSFDDIIDFAEIAPFIDTPVKRYSSGMYLRLAFAVAAHLRPEILIVDEVLAVGDASFQAKCLRKMGGVAKEGRTVLFVSHNLQAVTLLCTRAIALERGEIFQSGDVRTTVQEYLCRTAEFCSAATEPGNRPGSGEMRFVDFHPAKPVFDPGEEKVFHYRIEATGSPIVANVSAHIVDHQGMTILQCDSSLCGYHLKGSGLSSGLFTVRAPWLKPGQYRVDVFICASHMVDRFDDACRFQVSNVLPYPTCASADATGTGIVFADFDWSAS